MRRLVPLILLTLVAIACSNDQESISTTTMAPSTTATTVTTTTIPADPRVPVILDYSPTVSDIGALAFIVSHPDLRLVAVTLPGTGESYCEQGVTHTRGVLIELGLPDVPVACGPDDPITGWNAFPTSWRVGSNEMDLPEGPPNESRSAPELLHDLISESSTPIEIVAVGPLTNLALAFEDDPELADVIAGITIMGGAVDVAGNVFRNDVAEWNFWVDPTAADIVLASRAQVTLIPLDATNHLPASPTFFEALAGAATTPASVLVRDAIAANPFWLGGDGFFFWDELAAAVLADPSLVVFETRRLVVDDDLRENKGWSREDPAGAVVRVAVSADRRAFEQLYLDTLIGIPTELGYLRASPEEVVYFEDMQRMALESSQALDEVFLLVADELGIDLSSDEGFFHVIVAAVPRILEGPWQDRIHAMEIAEVPDSLAGAHLAWVDAMRVFAAMQDHLVELLSEGGFDGFDPLFQPVREACEVVQDAAAIRLIDVTLDCV